ncbi:DUF1294 domain-containing protein [Paenibacillus sp. 1001270B_150601_E10]|uniref:DUF1294 domain-containing protein n=1 Tax=Paenibacillus sp. 1001270B_150601_E10 TaxID=2787079 RepID=UPI00189F176F|nr:DUF1294 domain-containing protein [Paenibacillus sp. 1001270B_150601_E10]
MHTLTLVVFIYACVLNIIGYILMSVDKDLAVKRKRRIPEKRLFGTAWLGGALGVLIGMYHKHHKTQHTTFTAGIPFILVVNIVIFGFIIVRFG